MIPRGEVEGLDRGEVESDRKKYWERFYEKYEQIGAECSTTVGISEIDQPDLVEDRFRGVKRQKLELPVSRTLRRWVEEHGEEIDELATIAGPPSVDEEEISDEEDESESDDDLADLINDSENIPPVSAEALSPPSSPLPSLVDPSDSDSDLLLYSSNLPVSTKSIFAPLSLSKNINFKDKLIFSPQLSSSRNNSFAASDTAATSNLACSTCDKETEYSTRLGLDESVFQCDSCMLNDTHSGCGDLCEKCREIAAELDARWIHRDLVEGVDRVDEGVDRVVEESRGNVSILGERLRDNCAVDTNVTGEGSTDS